MRNSENGMNLHDMNLADDSTTNSYAKM